MLFFQNEKTYFLFFFGISGTLVLLSRMTSNIPFFFGLFLLLILAMLAFILSFVVIFLVPLALVNTVLTAKKRRKILERLGVSWQKSSNIQYAVLYGNKEECKALILLTGSFLIFYNELKLILIKSNYPEWFKNKLDSEEIERNSAALLAALTFRKLLENFRKVTKRHKIHIFTSDVDFAYWYNQDPTSYHYKSNSCLARAQQVLRTYQDKECITVECRSDVVSVLEDETALQNDLIGTIDVENVNLASRAYGLFA